jgi:hypothetical protein
MRGRLSIRQSDPRWFRLAGPEALDLQKINNEVAAIMKQQAVQPRTARSPEAQPRRASSGSPNRRRAAAKVAARARWDRATAEQKLAVGARLRTARQRRVKLLLAELVDGLVLDPRRMAGRAELRCERCQRPGDAYVPTLDARAPVLLRCRRHAYLRPGE